MALSRIVFTFGDKTYSIDYETPNELANKLGIDTELAERLDNDKQFRRKIHAMKANGIKKNRKQTKASVIRLDNYRRYHSIAELSREIGESRHAIAKRLRTKGEYVHDGITYKRESDVWIPKNFVFSVRCLETGEVFETVKALSERLGVDPSTASRLAKEERTAPDGNKYVIHQYKRRTQNLKRRVCKKLRCIEDSEIVKDITVLSERHGMNVSTARGRVWRGATIGGKHYEYVS